LKTPAFVIPDRLVQKSVVLCYRRAHSLGMLLPEPRAALEVREEERDVAGGETAHGRLRLRIDREAGKRVADDGVRKQEYIVGIVTILEKLISLEDKMNVFHDLARHNARKLGALASLATFAILASQVACAQEQREEEAVDRPDTTAVEVRTAARDTPAMPAAPDLPEPFATESAVKFARVVGWPEGRTPTAPEGFRVSLYAEGLEAPRWLYVLPNGDVLVSQARFSDPQGLPPAVREELRKAAMTGPSPNTITLLRDADHDGSPEVRETFLEGLNQPFGMLLLGDRLYIANTDGLVRYPYQEGQTRISAKGEKVLDLPAGGYNNHWTRNVVVSPDGSKLYVSVGSATNVDEEGVDAKDERRAAILEANPDGSGMRVFASGLRNPNGMGWAPSTNTLWTVVNERDGLGDDLVPDYLTSVRDGAFYGWPYSYYGQHPDPRKKGERPDLVAKAVVPDLALGSHVAALGLFFYEGEALPERYRGGAFIGEHGSWNRSRLSGYKVAFVPFAGGRPSGPPEDFLTGFIASEEPAEVYGRPVGLAELPDGSLLVADDAAGRIWRVSAAETGQ
jgi:glucose/arabinose dehydrogenase